AAVAALARARARAAAARAAAFPRAVSLLVLLRLLVVSCAAEGGVHCVDYGRFRSVDAALLLPGNCFVREPAADGKCGSNSKAREMKNNHSVRKTLAITTRRGQGD
ncbi:unnamed protein product, partial [Pelagomonas calceolata]